MQFEKKFQRALKLGANVSTLKKRLKLKATQRTFTEIKVLSEFTSTLIII